MYRFLCLLILVVFPMHLPARGGTEDLLTVLLLKEANSLHPRARNLTANWYLSGFINRHLLSLDGDGELRPDLLAELPFVIRRTMLRNHGPVSMVTLQLKDLARWGDGTPVTGADILFSWQVGLVDPQQAQDSNIYRSIVDIQLDRFDEKKCYLYIKKSSWQFLYELTRFVVLPRHLEEERFRLYSRSRSGYRTFSYYEIDPLLNGLYNGPYQVQAFKRGKFLLLERNKYFYGPQALSPRILITFVTGSEQLASLIRHEKVHVVLPPGLGKREKSFLRKIIARHNIPLVFSISPTLIYEYVALNMTSKLLSDWKVRKALLMGLDTSKLLQQDFASDYYRADHFLSPIDPWAPLTIPAKDARPELVRKVAHKLLDDAGWRMEKDSFRWRRGEKLKLTLVTNKEMSYRLPLSEFLREQWAGLGVDLHVQVQSSHEYFNRTLPTNGFSDMALLAWRYDVYTPPMQRFHSGFIPGTENSEQCLNFSKWRSNKVDQLLESLEAENDGYRREHLMLRVVQNYFHDIPELPLFFRTIAGLRAKEVVGYRVWGFGVPETYSSEFWHIAK